MSLDKSHTSIYQPTHSVHTEWTRKLLIEMLKRSLYVVLLSQTKCAQDLSTKENHQSANKELRSRHLLSSFFMVFVVFIYVCCLLCVWLVTAINLTNTPTQIKGDRKKTPRKFCPDYDGIKWKMFCVTQTPSAAPPLSIQAYTVHQHSALRCRCCVPAALDRRA